MSQSNPFASIGDALHRGELIPTADVDLFAKYFDALQNLQRERPDIFQRNVATGTGLLSRDFDSLEPEQLVSFGLRHRILTSLMNSGRLDQYMADNPSRERVIRAAATLPCTLSDLAFTINLAGVTPDPAFTSALAEMTPLDERFIQWMRDTCL